MPRAYTLITPPPLPHRHPSAGDYEIVEAEDVARGTKIVLHLKEDAHSFADEAMLESTIMRYSNFVSFPIYLNRRKVNTLRALWTVDPSDVEEQEFTDFYRYIASAYVARDCLQRPASLATRASLADDENLQPRLD